MSFYDYLIRKMILCYPQNVAYIYYEEMHLVLLHRLIDKVTENIMCSKINI